MLDNENMSNTKVMSAAIGNNDTCNCCCSPNMPPKVPVYSYNFTNIQPEEDTCEEKQETKEEMLNKIRSLDFAVVELAEYLDTHNDDKKALNLYKEYAKKLKELKDKYQMVYGPLSIYYPCNKWRWIEEPWPWEGGNN